MATVRIRVDESRQVEVDDHDLYLRVFRRNFVRLAARHVLPILVRRAGSRSGRLSMSFRLGQDTGRLTLAANFTVKFQAGRVETLDLVGREMLKVAGWSWNATEQQLRDGIEPRQSNSRAD